MAEEALFIEPFDLTSEFRRRQRATWAAIVAWGSLCVFALVGALASGFFFRFMASLLCVLFGRWCWVRAWPQYRYRRQALRCGPVTGAFETDGDRVSFVEMTPEPEQTLHSRRTVLLDNSCSLVMLPRGIGLQGQDDNGHESTLAILNKMFVDEEARNRFIALCSARYVRFLRD